MAQFVNMLLCDKDFNIGLSKRDRIQVLKVIDELQEMFFGEEEGQVAEVETPGARGAASMHKNMMSLKKANTMSTMRTMRRDRLGSLYNHP